MVGPGGIPYGVALRGPGRKAVVGGALLALLGVAGLIEGIRSRALPPGVFGFVALVVGAALAGWGFRRSAARRYLR